MTIGNDSSPCSTASDARPTTTNRSDSTRTASANPAPARSGLLRDLQDLYLLASLTDVTWTMVKQAAQALQDAHLLEIVEACEKETSVQLRWLLTRMKQAAPQALIAAK